MLCCKYLTEYSMETWFEVQNKKTNNILTSLRVRGKENVRVSNLEVSYCVQYVWWCVTEEEHTLVYVLA